MDNDNGKLNFGVGLDTSQLQKDAAEASNILQGINEEAEQQSAAVRQLLSEVPAVEIDFTGNGKLTLDNIAEAFNTVENVINTNKSAIEQLEKEYQRLEQLAEQAAQAQDADTVAKIREEQKAIQENVDLRKQVVEASEQARAELVALTESQEQEAAATAKQSQQNMTLKQRIKELQNAMADMVAQMGQSAAERTAEYQTMAQELGRLMDIRGDIQAQGRVFANDEQQIQAVVQGVSALSGAFSAAQGAMSLFGEQGEELQKVMLKVQAAMSLTMGLQQLQQMLNKDSAFQLVVVNGLKQWWAKIVATAKGVEQQESVALQENTAAVQQNAAANSEAAAAKTASTEATGAAATVKADDTATTMSQTAAEQANTAATAEHTAVQTADNVAVEAGAVASGKFATALRAVGLAIKSISKSGWAAIIAAIVGLVFYFKSLRDQADETAKAQERAISVAKEISDETSEAYGKQRMELAALQTRVEKFNGSKAQERKLCEELNTKYGEQLGYYYSVGEWKSRLAKVSELYSQQLLAEARAQALVNASAKAFVAILKGENVKENQRLMDSLRREYEEQLKLAQYFSGRIDDELAKAGGKGKKRSGASSGGRNKNTAAQKEVEKATKDWARAQKDFIDKVADQVDSYRVERMQEGQTKELERLRRDTEQRKQQWEEHFNQLAEVYRTMQKAEWIKANKKTEDDWAKTDIAKMPIAEFAKQLRADMPELAASYQEVLNAIDNTAALSRSAIMNKYADELVEQFGTTYEKAEKLEREWASKMMRLPAEYVDEAARQQQQAVAAVYAQAFKESIDWDTVFGDMGSQSIESLRANIERIRGYLNFNRSHLGTEEIKEFEKAIADMEKEIATRNPFSAFHKAVADIGTAKTAYIAACVEMSASNDALTAAQNRYNIALRIATKLRAEADSDESIKDTERYVAAEEELTEATKGLSRAREDNNRAQSKTLNAYNSVNKAYHNLAASIKGVGGVIKGVGDNAKNLAAVFSDDVAESIGTVLDTSNEVFDATAAIVDNITALGKRAAEGVATAVEATAQGVKASGEAGEKAMSSLEKASAILAIISSAMRVATAIINLFNNDNRKQKEIEALQQRIDELQWELDNADITRLQEQTGRAIEKVRAIYKGLYEDILAAKYAEIDANNWFLRNIAKTRAAAEAYRQSIEKIADAYAQVSYTADKALGAERWANSREQLEKYAEQQVLIMQQIDLERSKKKTDNDKIADWERKSAEIGEKMASLINEMLEEIIGSSAEDIAKQLGDAFFEAAQQGEDAMEAWHSKVKDIVADIIRRMLIAQYLEPEIGKVFDKYKAVWFGDDGAFRGIDAVRNSATDFAADLDAAGNVMQQLWDGLGEATKEWFDSTREGASRGIATASQDSVDENNARLTTIQGHTYNIVEQTKQLANTANLILLSVVNIDNETSGMGARLGRMEGSLKAVKDTVEDIAVKGIKVH